MTRYYRLVFRGKYLPGLTPDEVHANVAALFNVSTEKVSALLAAVPAVIKQNIEIEQGNRYLEVLAEAGLVTHLELMTDESGEPIAPGSWSGVERRAGSERRHRVDRRADNRGAAIVPDRRKNRGRRKADPH